jgi:hypothetical protein
VNKHFLEELQGDEDEFNALFMDFEQFDDDSILPQPIVCPFSSKVERLALGIWDAEAYAHLVSCKSCNAQYALSKRLAAPLYAKQQAFVAKTASSALKDLVFALSDPIKIGFSFGDALLAMGDETSAVSRIPLPLDKGSLCLKTNTDGLCQAWPEPSALAFELITLKGSAVLSRVFYKANQPLPIIKLTNAEKLQVKFDDFQLEIELAK